jgi:hypothetical protein
MNRRPELKTRRDLAVVDVDGRGNPRHLVVIPDDDAPAQLVEVEPTNIVSPLPEARVIKAQSIVAGSYTDRARAFSIRTWQLSMVTGLGLVVAAYALASSPLSFLAAAAWFFAGFLIVWTLAYLADVFVSAEGSQLAETLLLWRFLDKEQSERHRRYGAPQRSGTLDRVILAALFLAGLVGLLLAEGAI